jgi:hypothetical protein
VVREDHAREKLEHAVLIAELNGTTFIENSSIQELSREFQFPRQAVTTQAKNSPAHRDDPPNFYGLR